MSLILGCRDLGIFLLKIQALPPRDGFVVVISACRRHFPDLWLRSLRVRTKGKKNIVLCVPVKLGKFKKTLDAVPLSAAPASVRHYCQTSLKYVSVCV